MSPNNDYHIDTLSMLNRGNKEQNKKLVSKGDVPLF